MKAAAMDPERLADLRAVIVSRAADQIEYPYEDFVIREIEECAELLADRDHLAHLVGQALVIASLAPGETAATDHALTAAVDALRLRAEQAEAALCKALGCTLEEMSLGFALGDSDDEKRCGEPDCRAGYVHEDGEVSLCTVCGGPGRDGGEG